MQPTLVSAYLSGVYFRLEHQMAPSEFAKIAQSVIRDNGFEEFVPIACFPLRRELRGLADIPAADQTEEIVLSWANELAEPDEEFLVAFKHSATEFSVVRVCGSQKEHEIFSAA